MCEPAQPSHFTSYEEEVEPWDAPLRRRNNVSSHISSHLYHNNGRESSCSDIGFEDGMLVNEPFNRDPTIPMKKIKARKYDYSPRPSISSAIDEPRPFSISPTPYSSVGNLRDKFVGSNGNGESNSVKKRSAPRPPTDFDGNDSFEKRSVKKGPAPLRPISPYKTVKSDPIRELESIGKKDV